jgi:MFS family permease
MIKEKIFLKRGVITIDITEKSYLKYFLFGNLYFSEGIQYSIATVIIVIFFADKGLSIATTTLVAGIAASPWVMKFVFGPIVDHFSKFGRKLFIILGGSLTSVCLLTIAFVDPLVMIIPFTILLFIGHVGTIFLDVSSDGWAIQISKINERGKLNAAMTTGLFGGNAIGVISLTYIAEQFNYQMVFITAGIFVAVTIVFPLIVKENILIKKSQKVTPLLIAEFKKKTTILVTIFGGIAAINFGMLMFVIPEYMRHVLHLETIHLGLIAAAFPIATVIGAILGGTLADKFGRKNTLFVFLSSMIISSAALIFVNSWEIFAVIYSIIGFLQGGSVYSSLLAVYMDHTNPKIGASQYSIYTSVANFGELGVATISGSLIILLGYSRFFLYSAWVIGPALLLLYFIRSKN